MKKLLHLLGLVSTMGLILFFSSCEEETIKKPPTAQIFLSIDDKQVAFTALTTDADSWNWDFGDGQTSNEKAPVHIYENGGTYTIKLVATGSAGSAEATAEVSLALSVMEMLTGGNSSPNGKTWRISSGHSPVDAIALADQDFTTIQEVPAGALALFLGLGEEYEDTFTFKADGSYIHDNINGGSFAGLVFALVNQLDIVNITDASQGFGFCSAAYTPEAGASFTLTENKDHTVSVVSQADGSTTADITYKDVMTLSFSGTEFIGLMDFTREVIVQEITPDKMRLVMFMSATQGAELTKPSLAVIFTFEVVR